MSVDLLVADRLVQARTKGIAAQNADDKGIAGRAERLGRPFDEAREVVQEHGLNLDLGRRVGRQAVEAHQNSRCGEQVQHNRAGQSAPYDIPRH